MKARATLAALTALLLPGIAVHWVGPWASGYPVAQDNDPGWADRLLKQVA